jgi:hypothetical protein
LMLCCSSIVSAAPSALYLLDIPIPASRPGLRSGGPSGLRPDSRCNDPNNSSAMGSRAGSWGRAGPGEVRRQQAFQSSIVNLQSSILSCLALTPSSISGIVLVCRTPRMRPPAGGNGESDFHRLSVVNLQSSIVRCPMPRSDGYWHRLRRTPPRRAGSRLRTRHLPGGRHSRPGCS